MSSSDKQSYNVEKLNPSNYHTWVIRVQMVLMEKGLWDKCITKVAEERKKKKELRTEGDESEAQLLTEAYSVAVEDDQRALSIIGLTISDSELCHLNGITTAYDAWMKIKSVHDTVSLSTKLQLRCELATKIYQPSQRMQSHINEMKTLWNRLLAAGGNFDDEEFATQLLLSVRQEYSHLITAINARKDTTLSSADVISKLLQEESQRVNFNTTPSNPNLALQAFKKGSQQGKGNQKSKNEQRKCFHCGKTGHIRKDCRKKKSEETSAVNNAHIVGLIGTKCEAYRSGENQTTAPTPPGAWCIDSGASQHLSYDKKDFQTLSLYAQRRSIIVGTGEPLYAIGYGTVSVTLDDNTSFILEHVLYAPKAHHKLLSVRQIIERFARVDFSTTHCLITLHNGTKIRGGVYGGVYMFTTVQPQRALMATHDERAIDLWRLWHERTGHPSLERQSKLMKFIKGVDSTPPPGFICTSCIKSKNVKKQNKGPATRATKLLELIHSDVCGPFPIPTPSGYRYYVIFIDDYSRNLVLYLLRQKSEVFEKFKEYVAWVQCIHQPLKIQRLRSDNGGEYISNAMDSFLKSHGITHERTQPYTPAQAGVAERANRYLGEMTRCLLETSGLEKSFWGMAFQAATYLNNCLPSSSVDGKTPFELWKGFVPSYKNLKVFGSKVIVHIPGKRRADKLSSRGEDAILIGYGTEKRDSSVFYKVYIPRTGKVELVLHLTMVRSLKDAPVKWSIE